MGIRREKGIFKVVVRKNDGTYQTFRYKDDDTLESKLKKYQNKSRIVRESGVMFVWD